MSETSFFKNFTSNTIRDLIIGLIIAATCYIGNCFISLSKDNLELKSKIELIKATYDGEITNIKMQRDLVQTEYSRRFDDVDKKFDQLNLDINKKLDRINEKIDALVRDISKHPVLTSSSNPSH